MSLSGQLDTGTQIDGGTDNTTIGNVGDRLKVEISHRGSAMRILDMGPSNGGVARDTAITSTVTYTTVFSTIGSGYLLSFLTTLEGNLLGADPFNIRLRIDGNTCLEINTSDVGNANLYNLSNSGAETSMGMSVVDTSFRYTAAFIGGLRYTTSLDIAVKKAAGGSKRFRAGMVHLV